MNLEHNRSCIIVLNTQSKAPITLFDGHNTDKIMTKIEKLNGLLQIDFGNYNSVIYSTRQSR